MWRQNRQAAVGSEHSFPGCGFGADRDANAALNIPSRGLSELGVGHSESTPVETALPTGIAVVSAKRVVEAGSPWLKEPPTAASRQGWFTVLAYCAHVRRVCRGSVISWTWEKFATVSPSSFVTTRLCHAQTIRSPSLRIFSLTLCIVRECELLITGSAEGEMLRQKASI